MNKTRFAKLEDIYRAALDQPADERTRFLYEVCGDDKSLRDEIESLLSYDELRSQFIDSSPDSLVAEAFSLNDGQKERINREISHYRIVELIGEGGMGKVYLAEDIRLNRRVALKVLPDELVGDKDRLLRFEREAQATSALNHPNILTVHEFGDDDGVHFIATEFVDGETLRDKLRAISNEEALDVSIQVASALSAAHDAGITHRDIKPENIMIRRDGYVKVLDFGLARVVAEPVMSAGSEDRTKALLKTEPGSILGTDAYMSPEQARAKQVDSRSDVWSLGVVVYEMLTGRRPFVGETRADVIAAVLRNEPQPVTAFNRSLPPEADWIISKALSKDVDGRYQTAKEFRADLSKIKDQITFDGVDIAGRDSARIHSTVGDRIHSTLDAGQSTNYGQRLETEKKSFWPTAVSGISTAPLVGRLIYPLAGAAILAAVFAGIYFAFFSTVRSDKIDSIAVLPLENLSGDADLNFISDGMSEALIDRMALLPQLKVIARHSSFKFRGPNIDLRNVAAQLGVRAVVTGSVQRNGDDLVIRIDVVDVHDDRQLSGAQYRRNIGELESVRNDIVSATTEQLGLSLSGDQTTRVAEISSENSAAYRNFLNGIFTTNARESDRKRALEFFQKAVELDPNFAAAHAEIAFIHFSDANAADDPNESMPKAKAAAEKALALDGELAKAHSVRALVYESEFDWPNAEREHKRAIELSPNLDFARNNFAMFLSVLDRQDEALAQLEEQRARDPLNQRLWLLYKASVLVQSRRFDDALETYKQAQSLEPWNEIPNFALGYAYAGKGLQGEAIRHYKKAIEELGGDDKYSQALVYLAIEYAKIPEKRDEGRAILTRIENLNEYVSPALLAAVHTAFNDKDKAIELLQNAYIKRDLLLKYLKTGYEYDGLRDDPRFDDLVRKINR